MSFLDKARPTQKQPIQKQPTNTGLSFASKIKPKVNTIDIQKTKLQAQGLPVSVNKNRVYPTIGGGIVRGLAKIPVKIGLTIPAAFRGEKGVTLKSQYLGDTSDFAKTINEKADKLANRVNKGEISLGRALGGAVLNAATETADIASVVPVGGLGVTAAKNVVGAIAPKLAKPVVQTLGKSLGTSALRGGGTAALYDVGQQINEGDKYSLGQTLKAAGMGTALDVGLSTALPKVITKGKQIAGNRFGKAGASSRIDKSIRSIFSGTTGDIEKLNESAFKARKGLELLYKESPNIRIADADAPLGSGATKQFNLQKAKPNELLSAVSEMDKRIAGVARNSAEEASKKGVKININDAKQSIRESIDTGLVPKSTGERMLLQIKSTGGDPIKVHDWVQDVNVKYGKKYQRGTIDDTAIGSLADSTAQKLRDNLDKVVDRKGYAEAFGNNQELKRMLVTIAKKANKNIDFGNIYTDAGLDGAISILTGNPAYMARTTGSSLFKGLFNKFRNNAGLRAFRSATSSLDKIPNSATLPKSGIKIKEVPVQFRLPAGPASGSTTNPIILGPRTGESSVRAFTAKRGLVGTNPKTGKFTKTFTSEVDYSKPISKQPATQIAMNSKIKGEARTIPTTTKVISTTPNTSNVIPTVSNLSKKKSSNLFPVKKRVKIPKKKKSSNLFPVKKRVKIPKKKK